MRKLFIIALSVLALSGCDPCYNVECDAPDTARIDGLKFVFDINTSFATYQVDSAYIMLFAKGDWEKPLDSYSYKDDLKMSEDGSFMLTVGYPFSQVNDLADWNFVIFPNYGETVYRVSEVETDGYYPKDCCCCYRNTTKTFRLNNSIIERSGSEEAVILNR